MEYREVDHITVAKTSRLGTFLGNTTLPRVSPGELITLPLGVDPALHITYAKPAVKHSTQGIFTKDASQLFTRSIIITNTKAVPAEILVLDQVPLSEDEKLRVEIIEPRGLYKEGDMVSTGISASESSRKDGKGRWGNAKAMLKGNGQVRCIRRLQSRLRTICIKDVQRYLRGIGLLTRGYRSRSTSCLRRGRLVSCWSNMRPERQRAKVLCLSDRERRLVALIRD